MAHPWRRYRSRKKGEPRWPALEADESNLARRLWLHARKEWRTVHGRRMLVTVLPNPADLEETPE